MNDARGRILETAQALVQHRGYAGFSFRDIADAVGIKSASVHYHFSTKEVLAAELAQRYRQAFYDRLDREVPPESHAAERMRAFIGLFREALVDHDRMCLCGMLAAESELLSAEVRTEAAAFFAQGIDWLGREWQRLKDPDPKAAAAEMLAGLEGALLLARVTGNLDHFETVAGRMEANASEPA